MPDLQKRQKKMQEKRKKTPWREFLKEIVSLRTFNLYQHSGKTSIYSPTSRIQQVTSHQDFEEQRDALLKVSPDLDSTKSFFENFQSLWQSITLAPTVLYGDCENANFSDQTVNCKNCYLSYTVINDCENVLYSASVKENSHNVFNSLMVRDACENIYGSKGIIKSYAIFFSNFIKNSSNIWFSSNCIGCHECIQCHDLENKSYCIQNQQYEKEEYLVRKAQLLAQKEKFDQRYRAVKYIGTNIASHEVKGNANIECERASNSYMNYQVHDGNNVILVGGKEAGLGEHVYDSFLQTPTESHIYGVFSSGFGSHIYNAHHIRGGTNIYYSYILDNCSYCLGCIGLKNQHFCIFNKQFTKEERHKKVDEIFATMEQEDVLGNSFPGRIHPFYFNDSAAYLIDDSFTKEEVEAEGYLRRDEEIKVDIPEWMDVVSVDDLGQYEGQRHPELDSGSPGKTGDAGSKSGMTNSSWWIDPTILKKVIKDEKGNVYRIIKMEYDFLMKYALPLPRLHRLDRLKQNFKVQ